MKSFLMVCIICSSCIPFSQGVNINSVDTSPDTLRVLSWNIWMLPPLVKKTGKRSRAEKIGELLQNTSYDVLVFQEAFHHGARKKLWAHLKKTFPYRAGPANLNPNSLKTNSGIWILSRYPIEYSRQIRYKMRTTIDDRMARKGALLVEINKNGKRYQIIGTHLNAGGPVYYRLSQLAQLKEELLEKYSREGVPQIICGDFNIRKQDHYAYTLMLSILEAEDDTLTGDIQFTAGLREGPAFYALTGECASHPVNTKIIDYILLRKNGAKMISGKRKVAQLSERCPYNDDLSDHLPLEGVFIFAP